MLAEFTMGWNYSNEKFKTGDEDYLRTIDQ